MDEKYKVDFNFISETYLPKYSKIYKIKRYDIYITFYLQYSDPVIKVSHLRKIKKYYNKSL